MARMPTLFLLAALACGANPGLCADSPEGRLQAAQRLFELPAYRQLATRQIYAALKALPELRDAVVVAAPGASGMRLVAYVVAREGRVADPTAVIADVARTLPDYMVPAAVVVLEALPLNPNGKVDRRALPSPEPQVADVFEAPRGEIEAAVATLFAEVLGLARIGRDDNFFAAGGDSILSLKVVALGHQRGWNLLPRHVFEHPTVAALARVVAEIHADTAGAAIAPSVATRSGRMSNRSAPVKRSSRARPPTASAMTPAASGEAHGQPSTRGSPSAPSVPRWPSRSGWLRAVTTCPRTS